MKRVLKLASAPAEPGCLYYAMRPAPVVPIDNQTGATKLVFTRFRKMQADRSKVEQAAQRSRGRVHRYPGNDIVSDYVDYTAFGG